MNNKTRKMAGLFIVASLALAGGCTSQTATTNGGPCPDVDNDGICDDEEATGGSGVHTSHYSTKSSKSSSSMTSGTKGGIGSSGSVSSG